MTRTLSDAVEKTTSATTTDESSEQNLSAEEAQRRTDELI